MKRQIANLLSGKRIVKILLFALIGFAIFLMVSCGILRQPNWGKSQHPIQEISESALRNHVKTISEKFYPRNYRKITNLNKTADYIAQRFQSAGAQVATQKFRVKRDKTYEYKNVIGSFMPNTETNNSKKSPPARIIIGAHYDTHFFSTGADDNASGIAGLLELAPLIAQATQNHRIDLVAYTLEESPFFFTKNMGSYKHAEYLAENKIPVKAIIILEMVGFFTNKQKSQGYPFKILGLFYPNKGNFIGVAGDLKQISLTRTVKKAMRISQDLPVYSINAPTSLRGINFSDHSSYWKFGYKAVMVTDTAFYRYKHYHEISDTYEKLDYKKMSLVVSGVFNAILTIDSNF